MPENATSFYRELKTKTPFRVIFDALFKKEAVKYISGRVLDLGAGSSPYRSSLKNVSEFFSLDSNLNKRPIVYADAHFIPFVDHAFDTVLCTFLLEYVNDPRLVIKEIQRILKHNGIFVIGTNFLYRYRFNTHDLWRFTHEGLTSISIQDSGIC